MANRYDPWMWGAQAMKVNAKIGGVNWVHNTQPAPWMRAPYIVFGKGHANNRFCYDCVVTCRVCCSFEPALIAAPSWVARHTDNPGFWLASTPPLALKGAHQRVSCPTLPHLLAGADVTHQQGFGDTSPSVVAVVASMNSSLTRFAADVFMQGPARGDHQGGHRALPRAPLNYLFLLLRGEERGD